MTYQIVTAGRTHVDDFFKLSDVFTAERLNHTRPQQGIDQQIPCPPAKLLTQGRVDRRTILGGIIHDYYRAACLVFSLRLHLLLLQGMHQEAREELRVRLKLLLLDFLGGISRYYLISFASSMET